MSDIELGFRVETGEAVNIPLKHLAITGQTQEAGKTTTLEALIMRSRLKAVTFITKRGEGAFAHARRIDPYFREQADWQFVASLLEASRGEKLKFERAWIIRASKGARTLAEVHRNVKRAMTTAKGLSADVYLTLDAYLEAVVPQIAKVRWAPKVDIADGVNSMDLTALNVEMQHLVIKSTLDWVLEHGVHVVVVVPEAWKFIPQGRGTPVKLSAEAYIRQAAALQNFLWLDSQDLGGIEKTILRSVPVWLLGVQRETNEIARTLANIPASVAKPKPADIALLELGQFYACWGKHTLKTYVRPTWLDVHTARAVAMGQASVEAAHDSRPTKEDDVTNDELKRENERLRVENADLRKRLDALEQKGRPDDARTVGQESAHPVRQSRAHRPDSDARAANAPARAAEGASESVYPDWSTETNNLYAAFKARLLAEAPEILQVIQSRPELDIQIVRQRITVAGDSLRGRIARLIVEDYFANARTSAEIGSELERRGDKPSNIELGNELKALMRLGFFTRDNKWVKLVPDMVVNVVEK